MTARPPIFRHECFYPRTSSVLMPLFERANRPLLPRPAVFVRYLRPKPGRGACSHLTHAAISVRNKQGEDE